MNSWLSRRTYIPTHRADPIMDLRRVVKTFHTPAGDFTALKGVDLQIRPGEFVAVIGKSGSGKSTLINMMTGIDRPTLGEVIVNDTPIHTLNENQLAVWRGYNMGIIFQFFQLLPTLTLIENVMLPMEICSAYPTRERKERALSLLEQVGMVDQAYKFPSAVSGGQQQRVAIARALANEPYVMVADEPTGSLDTKTSDKIFNIFESFVAQGGTIIMVTHDPDLARRVSRVVTIADGEIIDQYVTQALPTLDTTELVTVTAQLEPVQYPPDTVIIRQGDEADKFFIIVRGEVRVIAEAPGGETAVIDSLGAGQYFGEIGLLSRGRRTATVKSVGEVLLMELDRDTFVSMVNQSELTSRDLVQLLARRQDVLREQVSSLIMSKLDADTLQQVDERVEILHFAPGDVIIRQGDKADKFYALESGTVEVVRKRLDGSQQHLNVLHPPSYFGEMGLLRGGKRNATVQVPADAAEPVVVAALDQATFEALTRGEAMLSPGEATLIVRQRLADKLGEFMVGLQRRKRTIAVDFD